MFKSLSVLQIFQYVTKIRDIFVIKSQTRQAVKVLKKSAAIVYIKMRNLRKFNLQRSFQEVGERTELNGSRNNNTNLDMFDE